MVGSKDDMSVVVIRFGSGFETLSQAVKEGMYDSFCKEKQIDNQVDYDTVC